MWSPWVDNTQKAKSCHDTPSLQRHCIDPLINFKGLKKDARPRHSSKVTWFVPMGYLPTSVFSFRVRRCSRPKQPSSLLKSFSIKVFKSNRLITSSIQNQTNRRNRTQHLPVLLYRKQTPYLKALQATATKFIVKCWNVLFLLIYLAIKGILIRFILYCLETESPI